MALIEEKRVALRPDVRIELRVYGKLIETRGVFMGVEVDAPSPPQGGIVTASATEWKRANKLKPRARAAGVALPAAGEIPAETPVVGLTPGKPTKGDTNEPTQDN